MVMHFNPLNINECDQFLALTWSNYKHHNTIKILVGITLSGAISFVSKALGGGGEGVERQINK